MYDYFCIAFMSFFMLFSGFISYLFHKDVIITFTALIKKDKNTTRLTPWQMIYHIFFGIVTGVASIMLMFGIILYFDIFVMKNQ